MDAQPNILFIMTDQQQAETLSCLGHPTVKTPNLDRIAARGVNFTKAYCPSPVCGPSRASMFCGLYPAASGVTKNYMPHREGTLLLPEALRRQAQLDLREFARLRQRAQRGVAGVLRRPPPRPPRAGPPRAGNPAAGTPLADGGLGGLAGGARRVGLVAGERVTGAREEVQRGGRGRPRRAQFRLL